MKWSHLKDYIGKMMIADFHDCNADCPPDCKYKDTTSAHSRFKIYHFNNYYFKQLISQKLYSKIQCYINHPYHFKSLIIFCNPFSDRIQTWSITEFSCIHDVETLNLRDEKNLSPYISFLSWTSFRHEKSLNTTL